MTTRLIGVQVTGIDMIDLLKPTLNVHDLIMEGLPRLLCTNHRKTSPYCLP